MDGALLFDWDKSNTAHLARRRITPDEVEEMFRLDPAIRDHESVDGEERFAAIGVTSSLRVLVLIFTIRRDRIRAITGWEADRKTKQEYFAKRET